MKNKRRNQASTWRMRIKKLKKKSGVHLENEDKERRKSGVHLENKDKGRMKKEAEVRRPPGE